MTTPTIPITPFPRMAEKRVRDENRRVEETLKERAMQHTMAKENARDAHDKHRKHFINTLDTINKQKVGVWHAEAQFRLGEAKNGAVGLVF